MKLVRFTEVEVKMEDRGLVNGEFVTAFTFEGQTVLSKFPVPLDGNFNLAERRLNHDGRTLAEHGLLGFMEKVKER